MFHYSHLPLAPGATVSLGFWGRRFYAGTLNPEQMSIEALWESVRAAEFPELISRLQCTYAYDRVEESEFARLTAGVIDGMMPGIYEVEPVDLQAPRFRGDSRLVDAWPKQADYPDVARSLARDYWLGLYFGGLDEILISCDLRVIGLVSSHEEHPFPDGPWPPYPGLPRLES